MIDNRIESLTPGEIIELVKNGHRGYRKGQQIVTIDGNECYFSLYQDGFGSIRDGERMTIFQFSEEMKNELFEIMATPGKKVKAKKIVKPKKEKKPKTEKSTKKTNLQYYFPFSPCERQVRPEYITMSNAVEDFIVTDQISIDGCYFVRKSDKAKANVICGEITNIGKTFKNGLVAVGIQDGEQRYILWLHPNFFVTKIILEAICELKLYNFEIKLNDDNGYTAVKISQNTNPFYWSVDKNTDIFELFRLAYDKIERKKHIELLEAAIEYLDSAEQRIGWLSEWDDCYGNDDPICYKSSAEGSIWYAKKKIEEFIEKYF